MTPRLIRDAWVLLGLAFAQMFLTFLFAGPIPYAYLTTRAEAHGDIKANLEDMMEFMEENSDSNLTPEQIIGEKGKVMGELIEAVPWNVIALIGSIIIYPFLGWWSARLLYKPQLGGLLILGSVLTQQNIIMVPRNMEYWNLAKVSLTLPMVTFFILFQFVLFTAGLLAQQGQALLEQPSEV